MKAKLLFFILITGLIFLFDEPLRAQYHGDQSLFKIGIETGLGTTTKTSPFNYGISLNMLFNYMLSPELSLIGSVGYSGLLTKDTSPIEDYHFIPVKTSIRIFPINEQVYLSPTVGAGFGVLKNSKPAFIFGGSIGYEWRSGYDLALKYEGYRQSTTSSTYQPLNGQFILAFGYYF